MANVTVMGGVGIEYGLKTAQKVQLTHNKEVADALLNISGIGTATGGPVHQDDPRPPQAFGTHPKMLYKPYPGEKGEKIVMDDVEEAVAIQDGWRELPYPKVQIEVLDPAQEKKNLLETNNNLQAQLALMQEQMNKLTERMTGSSDEPAKRAGRPSKSE